MDYIRDRLKEASTWIGLISAFGGIIMIFTPDNIDAIIEQVLPYIKQIVGILFSMWGVRKMTMPDKIGE